MQEQMGKFIRTSKKHNLGDDNIFDQVTRRNSQKKRHTFHNEKQKLNLKKAATILRNKIKTLNSQRKMSKKKKNNQTTKLKQELQKMKKKIDMYKNNFNANIKAKIINNQGRST